MKKYKINWKQKAKQFHFKAAQQNSSFPKKNAFFQASEFQCLGNWTRMLQGGQSWEDMGNAPGPAVSLFSLLSQSSAECDIFPLAPHTHNSAANFMPRVLMLCNLRLETPPAACQPERAHLPTLLRLQTNKEGERRGERNKPDKRQSSKLVWDVRLTFGSAVCWGDPPLPSLSVSPSSNCV